jgi:hypothetical protein
MKVEIEHEPYRKRMRGIPSPLGVQSHSQNQASRQLYLEMKNRGIATFTKSAKYNRINYQNIKSYLSFKIIYSIHSLYFYLHFALFGQVPMLHFLGKCHRPDKSLLFSFERETQPTWHAKLLLMSAWA